MGEKRINVIKQIVLEVLIIGLLGITLSLFAGNMIASSLSTDLLERQIAQIETDMDETALNRPWHFRDEDGILDMVMTPVYDNHTTTKLLWVDNSCHQVYGRFSGTVYLPEGEYRFEDLDAFVEHAHNRW